VGCYVRVEVSSALVSNNVEAGYAEDGGKMTVRFELHTHSYSSGHIAGVEEGTNVTGNEGRRYGEFWLAGVKGGLTMRLKCSCLGLPRPYLAPKALTC